MVEQLALEQLNKHLLQEVRRLGREEEATSDLMQEKALEAAGVEFSSPLVFVLAELVAALRSHILQMKGETVSQKLGEEGSKRHRKRIVIWSRSRSGRS